MQRQSVFFMPSRIWASVGCGVLSRSAFAVRIWPFWQKPHAGTCSSIHACCNGWSLPLVTSPSSVVTSPFTLDAGVTHERVATPLTMTVQAPHCPSPQPNFVVDKPGSYVARLIVNDGSTDSLASTVTISTANTPPVASAGSSVSLPAGATVHLDGSGSSDFDGNPLTYSWAITSAPTGSSAGLSSTTAVRPTFVADRAGTYLVQLIVNDGTVNSVASTMTVSTVSTPPVAFAGANQKTSALAAVQLDGSGSTDADGDPISYRWALISRPAGSSAALSSSTEPRPTFTADVAGTYVAQLIVRDAQWVSTPSTVIVTTQNNPPVSNAGSAQTVVMGSSVQLDGTHSTDVDGNALQFAWSILNKPATSAAIISDVTIPNPVFIADKAGDYVLQLIVNDGHAYSLPSTVTVSTSQVAPVANAGVPQLVMVGGTAQLDASASFDPSGGNLTYSWSMLSAPAGSAAVLSSTSAQNPTLVPDVAGDYNLQLVVSNGTLQSSPTTVVVSTTYALAVADPGTNQSVNVGTVATLDGGGSRSPQGSPLTYKWALIAQPAGSTAALNNTSAQSPAFTLDRRGTYITQLVVNDGHADSVPKTVTVTSPNRAPVANAGSAQSPSVGSVVTLDGSASSDPDGYPLTYQWRFTAIPNGSTPTLAAATSASPTFTADTLGTYKAELIVSDGLLSSPPSTVTITVGPNTSISFSPSPLDLNANQAGTLSVTIGQVAGTGGVIVNLTSSNSGIVTVPSTVTIPAGSSTVAFTATAQLTAGTATITGSATGYTTGSVTANITVNSMSMPNVTVGKNLQTSSVVTFGVAPSAAIDITLTSSDPSKVIVSNALTSGGTGSATVHVNASSTTSVGFFIQGLADSGTVTLTAKAAGYVDTTSTVTLAPSGIIVRNGTLATLNTTASSPDSALTVAPAYLDPTTKAVMGTESVRGGLGAQSIKLTNSSTSVGTLSAGSVSLKPGDSSATLTFHPLTTGSTDVAVTQPSGFTAPSNFTTLHVVVGQADISVQNLTVGQDLQATDTVFLSAPAPSGGVDVNLTSGDPSKLLLSTSATTAGSSSVTVHVNSGTQGLPVFYVQALAGSGTVTISAKGTGLNDGSATVTLMPSGFVITSGNISSGATGDTTVTLGTAVLQPGTLAPTGTAQGLRPGASPVNLTLSSSNPAVATISSPVAFSVNSKAATATFHAVSAGTTTVNLQTPTGFSTPSLYQSITATVGLPSLNTSTSIRVGKDLQQWNQVTLGATPASPVAISVVSNSPAIATVSTSATATGSAGVSFSGITSSTPNFYIQGISIGTTTLTVSAPGYADTTIHVTVGPSGFIMDSTSFSTSIGNDTTVTIAPAVLDSTSLNFVALQPLRGGLTVQVPMSTDAPSSGTISSPVSFTGNQAAGNATFHAIANGTVNITVGTPTGFSTPTTFAGITATVGLPSISSSIPVMTIGKDLQQGNQATLNATPSAPVSVTITSNTPGIATVSSDPAVAGTSSVTFTNITSSTPAFYIQGLSMGTATFTISASGYTDSVIHVTVNPSGFITSSNSFTSSVGVDTTLTVQSGLLDPNTLAFVTLQSVRGGLTVQVPLTSSTPATGTITTPVPFAANQAAGTATFHAVAAGTSTLSVGTPSGFSTPSNRTAIVATVQ